MFSKNIRRPFLFIYLPYLAILTLGFFNFIAFDYLRFYEIVKNNENLQVDLVRKSLARDFESMVPDIEILSNEQHIQKYIIDFDGDSAQMIENGFASFARQKRIYRTIRFIDTDGREKIRVDYHNGAVKITSRNDLKSQSSQQYFKNSIKLGKKELYISPIELNAVNDQIEIPFTPIIRFAMPVFDNQNIKKGIIVLNYDAARMLEHFDEMLGGSYGHISLLNQDGYWIRSHKANREWGFLFDRNIRFNKEHTREWHTISSQNRGQIRTDEGLFTFTSVYPLRLIGGYTELDMQGQHKEHHHDAPDSYIWKIVSDVPSSVINNKLKQHVFGPDAFIWLILALFGMFLARYLARAYTERKQLLNELKLHSQIYHSSTDGVIITDAQQNIVDVNAAFLEICGYSMDEILGNRPSMFSSGRNDGAFYREMWQELQAKGHWEGEICNRHKNGSVYIEWIRITAIEDEHGTVSNYIALVSDITHKKSTEELLLQHAHHDPLTGAHNRLSFDGIFHHELMLAKRNNRKMALLFFDLDRFKPINDTYGHQAGDLVLQTVVQRIQNNIRDTDTLARLGGDEFAVILAEISAQDDAQKVADTLRYLIREPIQYEDTKLTIDVSIGVAVYPGHGKNEKELISFADRQMYKNKTASREGLNKSVQDLSDPN